VSQGGWAVPGAISAAPVRSPIATASPANPLGSAATSVPTALSSNALIPLSYWYGHAESKRNPVLLDRLIRNLGENIGERDDNDPEGEKTIFCVNRGMINDRGILARVSGLIVDTPSSFASSSGSAPDSRHTLIKACVDAFRSTISGIMHWDFI
jgi:polyribonucleotide 5'-hydroxyl-kinase